MMDIETIWKAYSASLRGFLRTKLSNDADIDDLLQDILLKTHLNLGTIENHENIRAWLYKVAKNAVIDHYRKNGRAKELNKSDLWYDESSEEDHIFAECLLPFINALPEDSAKLLTAVDINGKAQKEIATEQGISYSTLKSRVQKARNDLKGLFAQCCDLSLDGRGNIVDYHPKNKHCNPCH